MRSAAAAAARRAARLRSPGVRGAASDASCASAEEASSSDPPKEPSLAASSEPPRAARTNRCVWGEEAGLGGDSEATVSRTWRRRTRGMGEPDRGGRVNARAARGRFFIPPYVVLTEDGRGGSGRTIGKKKTGPPGGPLVGSTGVAAPFGRRRVARVALESRRGRGRPRRGSR